MHLLQIRNFRSFNSDKYESTMMKTRAAVLRHSPVSAPYAQSRPLIIEEVQLDAPGPEELLIKIGAAGLCHSDLSVINGNRPRQTPMVLGHEAAGTVIQVGSAIKDLKEGDKVVMTFQPTCGHCLPCAEGRAALCIPVLLLMARVF